MPEPPIVVRDNVRVNALVRPAAEILHLGYEFFRGDWRSSPGPELGGWELTARAWRNVQLVVARRLWRGGRELAGVAILGTNEIADWTAGNLNFIPTRLAGVPGLWRRGFTIAGDFASSELAKLSSSNPSADLFLAGHSYGGAASVSAAAYSARAGLGTKLVGVIDFAGPRSCSLSGADFLSRQLDEHVGQRYSFGLDIVPWSVVPGLWRIALENVFISADGQLRIRMGFFRELLDSLRRNGLNPLRDHGMATYLKWASTIRHSDTETP